MIVSVGPLGPSHGPGECLSACSKAAGHSELESNVGQIPVVAPDMVTTGHNSHLSPDK